MGDNVPLWSWSPCSTSHVFLKHPAMLGCASDAGAGKTCREGAVPLRCQVWMLRQPPFIHCSRNWRLTGCSLLHPTSILALS